MARYTGVQSDTLRWLTEHPNVPIFASDISADTKHSVISIQSSIRALCGNPAVGTIEVLASGRSWRYSPTVAPVTNRSGQLFEYLATLDGGDLLIKSEDGSKVYRARELT